LVFLSKLIKLNNKGYKKQYIIGKATINPDPKHFSLAVYFKNLLIIIDLY